MRTKLRGVQPVTSGFCGRHRGFLVISRYTGAIDASLVLDNSGCVRRSHFGKRKQQIAATMNKEQQYWIDRFGFTIRQCEIAGALVDGLSDKEIADRFEITVKAVKYHNSAIFKKIGLPTNMGVGGQKRTKVASILRKAIPDVVVRATESITNFGGHLQNSVRGESVDLVPGHGGNLSTFEKTKKADTGRSE